VSHVEMVHAKSFQTMKLFPLLAHYSCKML